MALSDDGSTLAVGAWEAGGSGAVHVYVREGDTWVVQAHLKPIDPLPGDTFGSTLALSEHGDVLAVQSQGEELRVPGVVRQKGEVYVFGRTAEGWASEERLKTANGGGDSFGAALALSRDGRTLAAWERNGSEDELRLAEQGGPPAPGAIYVFERRDKRFEQTALVRPHAGETSEVGPWFGQSLAFTGDGMGLVVAGDRTYLLERGESGWAEAGLPPSDGGFPIVTNADGTWLAGGSTNDDYASIRERDQAVAPQADVDLDYGAVNVFHRDATSWSEQAYVKSSKPQAGENFGRLLALSADARMLIVGAPSKRISGSEQGAVYVFERTESGWFQRYELTPPAPHEGSFRFATNVGLGEHDCLLAVGETGWSTVYFWRRTDASCTRIVGLESPR